jgi:DnaA N-terminal domain
MAKKEIEIEVRHDMRDFGFFQTHNFIVDDYFPLIGIIGFSIYSLLVRRAMRDKMNTKLAQSVIREHLGIEKATVPVYILTLELCGLIYVNRKHREVSEMFILQPKQLFDPETRQVNQAALDEIRARISSNKKYASLTKTLLTRLDKFQSLFQRLDNESEKSSHVKVIKSSSDNPNQPQPITNSPHSAPALPNQAELVARLVRGFADAEPPLTEAAAMKMIEQYGVEAVKQQLAWLPNRNTNSPLKTLRAALKGNWSEPKPVGKAEPSTFTKEEMEYILARQRIQEEAIVPEIPLPDSTMWQEVKERLQMQLTQATFDSWIRPTELVQIEGNQWVIRCASSFAQDWLVNRLNGTLTRTVSSVAGREIELKFVIAT